VQGGCKAELCELWAVGCAGGVGVEEGKRERVRERPSHRPVLGWFLFLNSITRQHLRLSKFQNWMINLNSNVGPHFGFFGRTNKSSARVYFTSTSTR
jgi:hypothetical protein